MDDLRRIWSERAPREKLMLVAATSVLLLTLVYLLLIEPAVTGITRLTRSLPATRTQAVQLEQLLVEVNELKARPQVAAIPPAEARTALDKSLAAAGLKPTRITPLSDGDLQLTFANVSYATWSTWLANAERELGAKSSNIAARSTATPGSADIEVALRLARR